MASPNLIPPAGLYFGQILVYVQNQSKLIHLFCAGSRPVPHPCCLGFAARERTYGRESALVLNLMFAAGSPLAFERSLSFPA